MKKRKTKTVYMLLLCIFVLSGVSFGLTSSYFTDVPESLANLFTPGTIEIRLDEENWDESDADSVHPKERLPKNPTVCNTGVHPAFVFLEVTVPVKKIRTVDASGKKTAPASQELFSFEPDTANWELLDTKQLEEQVQYIYGYRNILYPKEQSTALFDEITTINYLEGELDPQEQYCINVQAKAIQSQLDQEHLSMQQIYEMTGGNTE